MQYYFYLFILFNMNVVHKYTIVKLRKMCVKVES